MFAARFASFILLVISSRNIIQCEELQPFRLPKSVAPFLYDLLVMTDLDENTFGFSGEVTIHINIKSETDVITLHAKDLNITTEAIKCIGADSKEIGIEKTDVNKKYDFFIVNVNEKLSAGQNYTLFIPFSGKLSTSLEGYYRSSYIDKSTRKKSWMAVTQFEAIAARKAFPCFDEPEFKASFKIRLGHKEGLTAISNMENAGSKPADGKEGWVIDEFAPSVSMSTYLVAYMICDMTSKEAQTEGGVLFRVWAPKGREEEMDFALEVGTKALSFYEDYYGIKFPLKKQDMIAVPDFSAGAMENWGMITFRDETLLAKKDCSTLTKYDIAFTVAHELAHQWFGNLVTMKWWTDLWLNEGFATYMQSFCTNHLYPDWNAKQTASIGTLKSVFGSDSLQSSHPISVKINDNSEIDQIFDSISYYKGSVLIQMMNTLLGEEVFHQGIKNYLTTHSYGSATQDDLWNALTEAAKQSNALEDGMTIKSIMDTWTLQTGFPVVTVIRNYDSGVATITQKRYLAEPEKATETDNNACWEIPLTYTTQSNSDFNDLKVKKWFHCNGNEKTITIENIAPKEDWVIFNVQFTGLYKIKYDDDNWDKLAVTMNDPNSFHTISVPNRVQIVNDAFGFAYVGNLEYKIPFKIFDYVSHETEYLPWYTAMSRVTSICLTLNRMPIYEDFKAYLIKIIKPKFEFLKQIPDGPKALEQQKMNRYATLAACTFEMEECITATSELFQKWRKDNSVVIPEEYKAVVFCRGIQKSGEEDWNYLWSIYEKPDSSSLYKLIIAGGLSCSNDESILNRYLSKILEENSSIRQQDASGIFGRVASTQNIGFKIAKDFLLNNMDKLKTKFKDAQPQFFGNFLLHLLNLVRTAEELKEITDFKAKYEQDFAASKMEINKYIESAKLTVKWIEKNYDVISEIVKQK